MTNLLLTLKNKHKRFQLIGNFHELFEFTVLLSKTELRLPFQGRMIKFSINYPRIPFRLIQFRVHPFLLDLQRVRSYSFSTVAISRGSDGFERVTSRFKQDSYLSNSPTLYTSLDQSYYIYPRLW